MDATGFIAGTVDGAGQQASGVYVRIGRNIFGPCTLPLVATMPKLGEPIQLPELTSDWYDQVVTASGGSKMTVQLANAMWDRSGAEISPHAVWRFVFLGENGDLDPEANLYPQSEAGVELLVEFMRVWDKLVASFPAKAS